MTETTRKSGWWYPYIFVAGFGVIITVNGILAYFATTSFSGLITTRPYEEGLAYNNALSMDDEQDALGWSVTPQGKIIEKGNNSALVEIMVDYRGENGAGIKGLEVNGKVTRPVAGMEYDQSLVLTPVSEGRYTVRLEFPQLGAWNLNITGQGDQGRYQFSQKIVIGADVLQRQWDGWCKQQCLIVK